MFASQRVRLATILVVGGVAVAGSLAAGWYEQSRADSTVRRDRAAVEAAARRLTYGEVAHAWTRMRLFDEVPLAAIKDSVAVRPRTVHDQDGAIIFAFPSGYGSRDVCLDLVFRPEANTVRTRGG